MPMGTVTANPVRYPFGEQNSTILVDNSPCIRDTFACMAITKRQREVYDFIHDFVQKNGYSPSFEEIGNGLGLSSLATVHKHVSNLEKKGLLKRDYNRSRSIDVLPVRGLFRRVPQKPAEVALPLMGRIAAGQPIEARMQLQQIIQTNRRMQL